jgi:hypothetical protein
VFQRELAGIAVVKRILWVELHATAKMPHGQPAVTLLVLCVTARQHVMAFWIICVV